MHMEIVAAGIVVRHDRERAAAALWSLITLLVWQVLILVPRPIAICVQHVVLPNFFKRRIGAQFGQETKHHRSGGLVCL